MLLCAARWVLGTTTLHAAGWISALACATALVGWFVWTRRALPRGITGTLLALVAAGCAVSTASLINPSTDLIVVALLPFVLLLTSAAAEQAQARATDAMAIDDAVNNAGKRLDQMPLGD